MSRSNNDKLAPLSDDVQKRVRTLIVVRGEAGARSALGIAPLTLAKAQGGMAILESTRAQIEARLAKLGVNGEEVGE